MLNDLSTFDTPLEDKLLNWKKTLAYDLYFINNLCNILYEEDKFTAIPQILKLSKYKHSFITDFIKDWHVSSLVLNMTQYQPIDDDQATEKKLTKK